MSRLASRRARTPVALLLGAAVLSSAGVARTDVNSVGPAVFGEPGLHDEWRKNVSGVDEQVDPFSGSLRVSHTDLVVPGNAGLDVVIQRSYSSNIFLGRPSPYTIPPYPNTLLSQSPVGQGWTLHFGRAIKSESPNRISNHICSTSFDPSLGDTTLDDAVLELPDGSLDTLYRSDSAPTRFITRRMWLADCTPAGDGLILYAPNGLKYTMNHAVSSLDDVTNTAWHTTAWHTTLIEDANGNYIAIAYAGHRGSYGLVSEITTSDGRLVTFKYKDGNLASITANGQTWQYEYATVLGRAFLTRVLRPDGRAWTYEYYPPEAQTRHVLRRLTYPYGATVTYSYDYADFMGDPALRGFDNSPRMYALVVATKTQGGRGVEPGTWRYTYAPASDPSIEAGFRNDVTTVDSPGGRHVFHHYGMQRQLQINDTFTDRQLWKTGLLHRKETYAAKTDGTHELVQTETYDWMAQGVISQQLNVALVYPVFDWGVAYPQLRKRTLLREGTPYVTEYVYAPLGDQGADPRPIQIVETGQTTRTTDLTWYPADPAKVWKFDQILYEIVDGNPRLGTLREFDFETGNLTALQPRGVVERYRHDEHGNVVETTNARGARVRLGDYHRGVPRNESREVYTDDWVALRREVNDTGTIRDDVTGRGNTTHYEYDDLDRVVSIQKPAGGRVGVSWDATGRTVTRGAYRERQEYDGFGRPICVETSDTTSNTRIVRTTRYDALGRKLSTSLPSEGRCAAALDGPPALGNAGDTLTTDVLGRPTGVMHTDGTKATTEYLPDNGARVTNERSEKTTYVFRSLGDPDKAEERVVMRIDAPADVTTAFTRNVLGQILSVTQGPRGGAGQVTRTNTYDSNKNFLLTSAEPETGTTTYVRDQVGNMVSRSVGSSPPTTYRYDGLNRLVQSSVPGAGDAYLVYDPDSNVTDAGYGQAWRHYDFDANGNITDESLIVDRQRMDVRHAYSALDHLESTRYHSGRIVTFGPDAFGRPTRAAPFVTSASHHPNGQPRAIVYANGVRTDVALDGRQFTSDITAPGIVGLHYDYDGRGNVTRAADSVTGGPPRTFSYDGLDRLTGAIGSWGRGAFSYDATGNLLRAEVGARAVVYDYDPDRHRLARLSGGVTRAYAYDTLGNVTSDGTTAFGFDGRGHLRSIGAVGGDSTLYDYDASSRQVRQQRQGQTTYFFHGKGGQLLGEYVPSPAGDRLRSKEYVYFAGKLAAAIDNEAALPTADADPQAVDEGSTVILKGRGTMPGGAVTGFLWSQIAGTPVNLVGADTSSPSFVAPFVARDTVFLFRLKIFTDQGTSAYADAPITVRDLKSDGDRDGMADGWELENFGNLTQPATADPDGDGVDNRHEFEGGSDPKVASPPTPVRGLTVIPGTASNTISWVPSFGSAPTYDLYWSQRPGFDPKDADATTNPGNVRRIAGVSSPFVHQSLAANEPYFYRVVARSAFGAAAPSPEQKAIVGQPSFGNVVALHQRARTQTRGGRQAQSADGTAFAIWSEWDQTFKTGRIWTARYQPGAGWMEATLLDEAAGEDMREPDIAMDASGNAIAAWARSYSLRTSRYSPAAGWEAPSTLSDLQGAEASLRMNASGRALLRWTAGPTYLFDYRPGVGWAPPFAIDGGSLGNQGSQSVLGDDGRAAVLFRQWDPKTDATRVSAITYEESTGWSRPTVLAEYPEDEPVYLSLVMDQAGRATAAWWQRARNYGWGRSVWATRHRPGGTWDPARRLDSDDGVRLNELSWGALTLATDGGGHVFAAWKQVDAVGSAERARIWGVEYDTAADSWTAARLLWFDDATEQLSPWLVFNAAGDGILGWRDTTGRVWSRRHVAGSGWQGAGVIAELATWRGLEAVSIDVRGNVSALVVSPTDVQGVSQQWMVDGGAVKNVRPAVNAGVDQAVLGGAPVRLSGAATRDVDGVVTAYRWTQVSGPSVSLQDPTTVSPSFTPPTADDDAVVLTFRLTVTDDDGAENSDVVRVTVPGPASDTDADGLGDRWEVTAFGDLAAYADGDPDGDGLANLQEFREGTNPRVKDPAPARVTDVAVVTRSATQNDVRWSPARSALRYNVYWRTSPGVTKANGTKIAGATSPHAHVGLMSGATYHYVVTAENGSGESIESAEVSATPRPALLGTWQLPQRVDGGGLHAMDARVVVDERGGAVAAWTHWDPAVPGYSLHTSTFAPGAGWSAPAKHASNVSVPLLAAGGDGAVFLVWREVFAGETWAIWSKRQLPGTGWESAPTAVRRGSILDGSPPTALAVAAGADGAAALIGLGDGYQLWAARFDGDEWLFPEVVSEGAVDPVVAVDGAGGVMAVYKDRDGTRLLSRRHTRTGGWGTELSTGGAPGEVRGPITELQVAMNDTGTAFVTWEEQYPRTPNEWRSRAWAARNEPGESWAAPYLLDAADGGGHGRPRVVVAPNGDATLAWWRSGSAAGDGIQSTRFSGGIYDSPVTVVSGATDRLELVGDARGDALMTWRATTTRFGWNGFVAGTGWGAAALLPSTGSTQGPDYPSLSMNGRGDAAMVWPQLDGTVRRLWASSFRVGGINQPPAAGAGADQAVNEGAAVTLTGTGTDPDGAVAKYAWTQTAGPAVVLAGATTAKATFTAPAVSASITLSFQLTVTDEAGATATDTVDVLVRDVPPPGRDLVVASVGTSATGVRLGGTLTVANAVANRGSANVTSAFSVRLYLSADTTITTADTVIATRTISTLAAGATNTANTTATVPTSLAVGTYFIGVIADNANAVTETNETNNALAGTSIAVSRDVDLTMTALSTSGTSVARGGSLTLSNTVKNQGANPVVGSVEVRLYLSTDQTISTSDVLLATRTVTSLAAGASSAASTKVTVPRTLAAGSYTIGGIVDPPNAHVETNETNNARSGARIQVR